jgi:hypothetical protein
MKDDEKIRGCFLKQFPEGQIQEWVNIGWKVYDFAYKGGYDIEVCVEVAKSLAREKGLPEDDAENLAKEIVKT